MDFSEINRFQDFFLEDNYISLKNFFYNYRIRKNSIEKKLKTEKIGLILEVGSGISPVITFSDSIVYSDLSFTALKILKQQNVKGAYVVADAMNLPFKNAIFSHTISSEVLEHLSDDQCAIKELNRVMKCLGRTIITFPHRKFYYSIDDRFVCHFRRYELFEMIKKLEDENFQVICIKKVLGPLEKITMHFAVFCYSLVLKLKSKKTSRFSINRWGFNIIRFCFKWANIIYMSLALADAKIMPLSLSAVIMIEAVLLETKKNI